MTKTQRKSVRTALILAASADRVTIRGRRMIASAAKQAIAILKLKIT